jgi:hypothetical protein
MDENDWETAMDDLETIAGIMQSRMRTGRTMEVVAKYDNVVAIRRVHRPLLVPSWLVEMGTDASEIDAEARLYGFDGFEVYDAEEYGT